MTMRKHLAALLALTLSLGGLFTTDGFAADRPLLIPGKQALFQRVLAVPGARLHSAPGGSAGDQVTPFTAFYVYARETLDGMQWLQIGTDRHGGTTGWLTQKSTIEWTQGLTVAFREAIGRDRALLFRDAASVRDLASQRDLARYTELYRAAEAGEEPGDSPVVAI